MKCRENQVLFPVGTIGICPYDIRTIGPRVTCAPQKSVAEQEDKMLEDLSKSQENCPTI